MTQGFRMRRSGIVSPTLSQVRASFSHSNCGTYSYWFVDRKFNISQTQDPIYYFLIVINKGLYDHLLKNQKYRWDDMMLML